MPVVTVMAVVPVIVPAVIITGVISVVSIVGSVIGGVGRRIISRAGADENAEVNTCVGSWCQSQQECEGYQ